MLGRGLGQGAQAGDQEAGRMGRVWVEVGDTDQGMLCPPREKTRRFPT